jgi:hypothetical protein
MSTITFLCVLNPASMYDKYSSILLKNKIDWQTTKEKRGTRHDNSTNTKDNGKIIPQRCIYEEIFVLVKNRRAIDVIQYVLINI